jgi:CubicO group peptidase (beta-lactamase class C family)
MNRRWHRRALLSLVALLLAAGCSSSDSDDAADPTTTTAPAVAFPSAEWARTSPAEAGLDETRLDELERSLQEQNSSCMAVVKDGQLVRDAYWNNGAPDRNQEVFSTTKSFTSMLVGIAQAEGALDINQPASDFITEWKGTPSESVTIRDLLANVSGREWSLTLDYRDLIRAPDKTGFAIGLGQQHEPGTDWEYNNAAIQTLEAVLERSTGEAVPEFARTRLFEPLGMTSTMGLDGKGNALTFMGVKANCLDLARFGHLLLQEGRWNDEQVIPAEYVREATTPATDLNAAYGYLIWLNQPGLIKLPAGTNAQGPIWPDAPPEAFAALGLGGQTVLVVPSEGLVVTREGPGGGGGVQQQGGVARSMATILFG